MSRETRREGSREISYVLTRPGASVFRMDPADDPLSPSFLPLEKRSEIDKARFWVLHSQGNSNRPAHGEFDG